MKSIRIEGTTRVVGESQGYLGLAIRDELVNSSVDGENTPCMTTLWQPTFKERLKVLFGQNVKLLVLGRMHPPVMMEIGK